MRFNLDKNKLIWAMKGATVWQHDISPLTIDGDKISIFNNGSPRSNLESDYFENA